MKVELTDRGLFTLTAETPQDNNVLFVLINTKHLNGVRYTFGKTTKQVAEQDIPAFDPLKETLVTPVGKRAYIRKKQTRLHTCPVEGCGEKVRGVSLHKVMTHGIQADGTIRSTFNHAKKGETKVSKPVVQLGDGTYKVLAQSKPSFLD